MTTIQQLNATAMHGPEFLDAIADTNALAALDIDAGAFRQRAYEWARDKQVIAGLREALQDANDRLSAIKHQAFTVQPGAPDAINQSARA